MKIEVFSRISRLKKENAQFVKDMLDIRSFAERQWRDGKAGLNKTREQYVMEQRLEALEKSVAKQAEVVDVTLAALEQVLNLQAKQHIDMVKLSRKERFHSNVVEEAAREAATTVLTDDGAVLMDPAIYSRGSRISWNTIGLVPRDIAFNEFDLARSNDPNFDVFNQHHIRERWSTLALNCRSITGMTLSDLQKAYAKRRGLEYTPPKRGRKPKKGDE